jgi:hypothetical protein
VPRFAGDFRSEDGSGGMARRRYLAAVKDGSFTGEALRGY